MEGITEPMRQYVQKTEEIWGNKPKHGREYGVKRPESAHIIVVMAVLFAIIAIMAELMI